MPETTENTGADNAIMRYTESLTPNPTAKITQTRKELLSFLPRVVGKRINCLRRSISDVGAGDPIRYLPATDIKIDL